MTALAEAMNRAGIRAPRDEMDARMNDLIVIAVDAWGKFPAAIAAGARRDYVMQRLPYDTTRALIERWRPTFIREAVEWLLARAADHIRDARDREREEREYQRARNAGKPATGGGHPRKDNHISHAPSGIPSRDAGQPAGGGHHIADTQEVRAPATPSPDGSPVLPESRGEQASSSVTPKIVAPARPTLQQLADKQARAGAMRLQVEQRLSRLDTVKIDGKPIGDCTAGEARAWAVQRQLDARAAGRDARFALALISGLPSGSVIRDWWRNGAEVDAIYEKAEAEHAA